LLGVVEAGFGTDAVPLGLVGDLIAADASDPELKAAAVRLERFTSGRRIDQAAATRWGEAAGRVIRGLEVGAARPFLARADQLAAELYLAPFAGLSGVLPSGFEARLNECGERLRDLLANPGAATSAALEHCAARVRDHLLARSATARVERVEMATRLARWLVLPTAKPSGLDAHVSQYVADGAFVDWARLKLLGGDQLAGLSAAFGALAAQARELREDQNRAFAESLKAWNQTGSTSGAVVLIETILDALVAPLAEVAPVLVLVVDGLSLPVFAELSGDTAKLGWTSLARDAGPWPGAAIAALPTVTEVSRASLLAGRITAGVQHAEKTSFAAHPALAARSRPVAPVLFHKGELEEGLGLSARVRETVGGQDVRVVAVVYNAIDDQLDGATQVHLRWSLDDLRLLPALLHEARGAGRVVVLTADHGHVVEHETLQLGAGEGDRWRHADGALRDGEIAIEGGRVRTPSGGGSVTVPWSERVRYGAKKNGYHGGVSPQEAIVPLCVLAPSGMLVPGWRPALPIYPEWWQVISPAAVPSRPVVAEYPPAPQKKRVAPQPDLFSAPAASMDWVATLLASPAYKAQRTMAARVAPEDDVMRRLLEALAERGGKLAKAAVAARLNLPAMRVNGFLSAARRVLNIDQSAVLTIDNASGMVELNLNLLQVQFELGRRE
jgi:hypothetical protein